MNTIRILFGFFCLCTMIMYTDTVFAKTFVVNTEDDTEDFCAEVCSLRAAILESETNGERDLIMFSSDVHHIILKSELIIKDDIQNNDDIDVYIRGTVALDADYSHRVLSIQKNAYVILSGLSIEHGYLKGTFPKGAGIYNEGTAILRHVQIQANSIVQKNNSGFGWGRGAGIYNTETGTMDIRSSHIGPRNTIDIASKDARGHGGGIYNGGDMTIQTSNIYLNYVYTRSGVVMGKAESRGAGIFHASTIHPMKISQSAIVNNVSHIHMDLAKYGSAEGAGIYLDPSTMSYITNSTISKNSARAISKDNPAATTYAHGGGIYATAHTKLYGANLTIADNDVSAPYSELPHIVAEGAALYMVYTASSDIRFMHSIITSVTENCNHDVDSDGYNIFSDDTCGDDVDSDVIGSIDVNPLSMDNSKTFVHSLPMTSIAIDAGSPDGCFDYVGQDITVDQRNKKRTDDMCDIGSYEK